MKIKIRLLAIFLTCANLSLHADTAPAPTEETTAPTTDDPFANEGGLPESKYVTEEPTSTSKKKDKSRLYNFLLASAAIVVATVAIIMVSDHQGKSAN